MRHSARANLKTQDEARDDDERFCGDDDVEEHHHRGAHNGPSNHFVHPGLRLLHFVLSIATVVCNFPSTLLPPAISAPTFSL